ncbi:MAG: hypothetical protein HQL28_07285 [Candidatus Omnitrophica bacterium]|nr:hypothetical protein [Candidatus Omnitrophota bacterium]
MITEIYSEMTDTEIKRQISRAMTETGTAPSETYKKIFDVQWDIYSFGLVLLNVLDGEEINKYEPNCKCLNLNDAAIFEQMVHETRRNVGTALGYRVYDKKTGFMYKIVEKCLESRETRYKNMDEVIAALKNVSSCAAGPEGTVAGKSDSGSAKTLNMTAEVFEKIKELAARVKDAGAGDKSVAIFREMISLYSFDTLEIRKSVLDALKAFAAKKHFLEVKKALLEAAASSSPAIAAGAAVSLGYIYSKADIKVKNEIVVVLASLIFGENDNVRCSAFEALRYINCPAAGEFMKKALYRLPFNKLALVLQEYEFTKEQDYIFPILNIYKKEKGVKNGRLNMPDLPTHIACLINAGWIARGLEKSVEKPFKNITFLEYVDIAFKFGYIDDGVYAGLKKEKPTVDPKLVSEILSGGIETVTSTLYNTYNDTAESDRQLLLEKWMRRVSEFQKNLTDKRSVARKIASVKTGQEKEDLLDQALFFTALRVEDRSNIEAKIAPKPFERKHELEQSAGEFYFYNVYRRAGKHEIKVFDAPLEKLRMVFRERLIDGPILPELEKVLMPFAIGDYFKAALEMRKEEHKWQMMEFYSCWETLARVLSVKGDRLLLKDEYLAVLRSDGFIGRESCALDDEKGLAGFISDLAAKGLKKTWKWALLDVPASSGAAELLRKYSDNVLWTELSFGAHGNDGLKVYQYRRDDMYHSLTC